MSNWYLQGWEGRIGGISSFLVYFGSCLLKNKRLVNWKRMQLFERFIKKKRRSRRIEFF